MEVTESQELYLIPQAEDVLGASRAPGLAWPVVARADAKQWRWRKEAALARGGPHSIFVHYLRRSWLSLGGEVLFLGTGSIGFVHGQTAGTEGAGWGRGPTSAPTMERHFRALLAWMGARWCWWFCAFYLVICKPSLLTGVTGWREQASKPARERTMTDGFPGNLTEHGASWIVCHPQVSAGSELGPSKGTAEYSGRICRPISRLGGGRTDMREVRSQGRGARRRRRRYENGILDD
jgi:hypothetical protein